MDSHKCKLCSRLFTNGRALGGHMKAHLTAPPPPVPPPLPPSSSSSFSSSDSDDDDDLKQNPKRNFRLSDPVFNIVLQDKESETESKNPTRKRSKRRRKLPETASSISDTDLAMCLMMLSRDRRIQNRNQISNEKFEEGIKEKKAFREKKKCEKCTKQFRSYKALFSHGKVCELKTELKEDEDEEEEEGSFRIFKCPFCAKVFGSGQALGGHKRTHLVSSTNGSVSLKLEIRLIDLNLPAPIEEHDYTV